MVKTNSLLNKKRLLQIKNVSLLSVPFCVRQLQTKSTVCPKQNAKLDIVSVISTPSHVLGSKLPNKEIMDLVVNALHSEIPGRYIVKTNNSNYNWYEKKDILTFQIFTGIYHGPSLPHFHALDNQCPKLLQIYSRPQIPKPKHR